MDLKRAERAGTIGAVGGGLLVTGALVPFDWVFALAALATGMLAYVAWTLGCRLDPGRDPRRQAGGLIAAAGLGLAATGFIVALLAALTMRPDIVMAMLASVVSTGLYVVLPIGLLLLGTRILQWDELSTLGRWLPLLMGLLGVLTIPATVLISLPWFEPGAFATFLGLVREIPLAAWIPLGVVLRRAGKIDDL